MGDRLVQRGQVDYLGNRAMKPKACSTGNTDGIYEFMVEVDLGAHTWNANNNDLVKTIATIPTLSHMVEASVFCTEANSSAAANDVDLVVSSTTPAAVDDDMTVTGKLIDAMDLGSDAKGAIGAGTTASGVDCGAGTHLCLVNGGTGNGTSAITSLKLLVYIKYFGTGPAVINTTV